MSALPLAMNRDEAEKITSTIQTRLATIADNAEAVVRLIEQARAGDAHAVLGFASWTAYVADKFGGSLARLEKVERMPVVATLAETGMSTRAIADVVGVSKSTVDREVSHSGTPAVGTDGKTYVRPATFLRSGKPDANSTEDMGNAVPAMKKKVPRKPLPEAYRKAVWELQFALERLQRLHADDRFLAQRKDIAQAYMSTVSDLSGLLNDIDGDLFSDNKCRECDERMLPERGYEILCKDCR